MKKLQNTLKLKLKIPTVPIQMSNIIDNRQTISEILPNIFVSGYIIAKDTEYLLKNNFTHVINCAGGSSVTNHQPVISKNSLINNLLIYLRDDPAADIISSIFLTINFIESQHTKTKILFHCIEGVSRGPALLAGYIMWKKKYGKEEAINLIQSKRDCVDINIGFMVQLNKWESYLIDTGKLCIFELGRDIILLNEKEIFSGPVEADILENQGTKAKNNKDYLVRWKRRLFQIKSESNEPLENVKEFIENVKQYDKELVDMNIFVFVDNESLEKILNKIEGISL